MRLARAVGAAMLGQLTQLMALNVTHLFGDNMVLDFREPAVHGRASPGAAISVSFNGVVGKTTASTDGAWRAVLGGSACAGMPRNATLTVADDAGGSAKAVNVACGQVFVCTGQSNMELTLAYVNNGSAEIAASSQHPNLRLFAVGHMNALIPQPDTPPTTPSTNIACTNNWMQASPAAATNFSAVCYLTATRLAAMSKKPGKPAPVMGLIHAPYGGTPIEAWSPPSGLAKCVSVGETGTPFSRTTPWGRAFVGTPWCKVGPPLYPGAVRGFNQSCASRGKNENSSLYNGMIAPLIQTAISGVLWFQGEENAAENRNQCGGCSYGGGPRYACLMGAMIESWRQAWVTKDFPFAMVQLAAYYSSGADINAIRIAQAVATATSANTGMALAIDHGDPTAPLGPVHSRDKEPIGTRLAATMFKLRGCVSDCSDASSCKPPTCVPYAEGATLASGGVLRTSGPSLTAGDLVGFANNISTVSLKFNHSVGLRFGNTSLCNISQPVGSKKVRRRCCAALPDTMKLCLDGPGAANAPYDINASTCFSAEKVVAVAATGSVQIQSVSMPRAAGWVQWSADPYPECALFNDAGLPASPFAAKLALRPAKDQTLNLKADDESANVYDPAGRSGSPENTWIENDVGLWKDTDGNPLHAHGAGMYLENGQYYLVGNSKMTYDRPYFNSYSIALYVSSDLGNWTLLSASILNKSAFTDSSFRSPLINPRGPVLFARPKLIKSQRTGQYILWAAFGSTGSGVCVASSATIDGNYDLESCFIPSGDSDTCDMTVVLDKGEHYLIADTEHHSYNGVSRLDAAGTNLTDVDCLKIHCNGTSSCAMWSRKNTSGEAPAFFRDPRSGRAYLWNSHLAGWAPAPAMLYEGETGSLCGAGQQFKLLGNPSLSYTTHNSQSTYIQPVTHADGSTTLLYMSDRWCWDGFAWAGQPGHLHPSASPTSNFTCVASGNVSNATYVWLPLYPNASAPSGWSLPWLTRWRIGDPAYRIPAGNAQL